MVAGEEGARLENGTLGSPNPPGLAWDSALTMFTSFCLLVRLEMETPRVARISRRERTLRLLRLAPASSGGLAVLGILKFERNDARTATLPPGHHVDDRVLFSRLFIPGRLPCLFGEFQLGAKPMADALQQGRRRVGSYLSRLHPFWATITL